MISKATATLCGMLLTGTLLTGVGVGIATVEYTSFKVDTTTLGDLAEITTDEITYEMVDDELIDIANPNCTVVFDDAVREGTILMQITYAPELSYINYWTDSYLDDEGQRYTHVQLYTYFRGYEYIMLEHKDMILQGLKDGVLYVHHEDSTYDNDDSVKVVKLNPADKDRLADHQVTYHEMEYIR